MKLCCSLSRPLYIDDWHTVSRITGLDQTVRNEPILSGTDIDNIKATKLIMGHHIVACEEFYVHNNIYYDLLRTQENHTRTGFLTERIYATSHDATQK